MASPSELEIKKDDVAVIDSSFESDAVTEQEFSADLQKQSKVDVTNEPVYIVGDASYDKLDGSHHNADGTKDIYSFGLARNTDTDEYTIARLRAGDVLKKEEIANGTDLEADFPFLGTTFNQNYYDDQTIDADGNGKQDFVGLTFYEKADTKVGFSTQVYLGGETNNRAINHAFAHGPTYEDTETPDVKKRKVTIDVNGDGQKETVWDLLKVDSQGITLSRTLLVDFGLQSNIDMYKK